MENTVWRKLKERSLNKKMSKTLKYSKGYLGPCFIATAAYGTSFNEELYILRNFRDTKLRTNALGKKLVAFYYKYSPPIAKFIEDKPILRLLVRWALLPIILILKRGNK